MRIIPRGLLAASLFALAGVAGAAVPAADQVTDMPRAEQPPSPDAPPKAAPNPKVPPKKVVIKKTGQVVYKCGEAFTDQPVCPDNSKPQRLKRSPEDEARCEQFKRTDYIPWYCRK